MKSLGYTFVLGVLLASTALSQTNPDEKSLAEDAFYLLRQYKLIYPQEIFEYCLDEHGADVARAGNCMQEENKLKQGILDEAYDQLGRRRQAQGIYDECLDYYLTNGAKRIGECVRTRLMLNDRLQDETVEKAIYHKCDRKWRKHGAMEIDTCCRTEATYYLDKGKLQD